MLRAEPGRRLSPALARAARSLSEGEPILVFDAAEREGETDLVFLSERATPELVRLARTEAGGLICTAISDELRRRLDLPFYSDLLAAASKEFPSVADLSESPRYDRRSAFGITINHRSNYTGVPDNDRALDDPDRRRDRRRGRPPDGLRSGRAVPDRVRLAWPRSSPVLGTGARPRAKGTYGARHLARPDGRTLRVRDRL